MKSNNFPSDFDIHIPCSTILPLLRKESMYLQHQTFTCEDKGRIWRSFICSSTWTDGLYGWNWEFHWCQFQFSQVYRLTASYLRFCYTLLDYHLFADAFLKWLSVLKKFALETAERTIRFLSVPFTRGSIGDEFCLHKIRKIKCLKYRWVFTLCRDLISHEINYFWWFYINLSFFGFFSLDCL